MAPQTKIIAGSGIPAQRRSRLESFGAPEIALTAELAVALSLTVPVAISAWKLRVSQPWWGLLPVGNIVTLVRVAGRPWWTVLVFLIPFANLFAWGACWVDVAERGRASKAWGYAAFVPLFGLLPPWFVAAAIPRPGTTTSGPVPDTTRPKADEIRLRVQQGSEVEWERRPDGVWMRRDPATGAWEGESRGVGTATLFVALGLAVALATAVSLGAVAYDYRESHLVFDEATSRNEDVEYLSERIRSQEGRVDVTMTVAERAQLDRSSQLAAAVWIANLVRGGQMTTQTAAASLPACIKWVQTGSPSFEEACQ